MTQTDVLGLTKRLVKALTYPRVLLADGGSDYHHVHDGENAGAPEIVHLHGFEILKQSSNARRIFDKTGGHSRGHQGIDFTGFEHLVQSFVFNQIQADVWRRFKFNPVLSSGLLHSALNPTDFLRVNTEIVLEHPAKPD